MTMWSAWFGLLVGAFWIPLLVYLAFALPALMALRSRRLDDATTALWALTIVAVPVMGPVAFAVLAPGAGSR